MKNFSSPAVISERPSVAEDRDSPFSSSPENQLGISVRADIQDTFDSIRASGDLEPKLRNFIFQCEAEIGKIENNDERNKKAQELGKSEIHLIHALGDFYESLDPLTSSEIELEPDEAAKLIQIRSLIPQDFLNRLSNFYQFFEASLSPVLRGAATRGAVYFMDSPLAHSETAAGETERLLRSMHDGNETLAYLAQCSTGTGHSTVDHEGLLKKMNSVLPKRKRESGAAEGLAYSMFSSELGQQVIRGLGSESPDILKDKLLLQIQMNLNAMRRGVTDQVLGSFEYEEIEGKQMRILTQMQPARQLEMFYKIVNLSMNFARNARLQKTLLSPSADFGETHFSPARLLAIR